MANKRSGRYTRPTAASWQLQQQLAALQADIAAAPTITTPAMAVLTEVGVALNTLAGLHPFHSATSRSSATNSATMLSSSSTSTSAALAGPSAEARSAAAMTAPPCGEEEQQQEQQLMQAALQHLRALLHTHNHHPAVVLQVHAHLFMACDAVQSWLWSVATPTATAAAAAAANGASIVATAAPAAATDVHDASEAAPVAGAAAGTQQLGSDQAATPGSTSSSTGSTSSTPASSAPAHTAASRTIITTAGSTAGRAPGPAGSWVLSCQQYAWLMHELGMHACMLQMLAWMPFVPAGPQEVGMAALQQQQGRRLQQIQQDTPTQQQQQQEEKEKDKEEVLAWMPVVPAGPQEEGINALQQQQQGRGLQQIRQETTTQEQQLREQEAEEVIVWNPVVPAKPQEAGMGVQQQQQQGSRLQEVPQEEKQALETQQQHQLEQEVFQQRSRFSQHVFLTSIACSCPDAVPLLLQLLSPACIAVHQPAAAAVHLPAAAAAVQLPAAAAAVQLPAAAAAGIHGRLEHAAAAASGTAAASSGGMGFLYTTLLECLKQEVGNINDKRSQVMAITELAVACSKWVSCGKAVAAKTRDSSNGSGGAGGGGSGGNTSSSQMSSNSSSSNSSSRKSGNGSSSRSNGQAAVLAPLCFEVLELLLREWGLGGCEYRTADYTGDTAPAAARVGDASGFQQSAVQSLVELQQQLDVAAAGALAEAQRASAATAAAAAVAAKGGSTAALSPAVASFGVQGGWGIREGSGEAGVQGWYVSWEVLTHLNTRIKLSFLQARLQQQLLNNPTLQGASASDAADTTSSAIVAAAGRAGSDSPAICGTLPGSGLRAGLAGAAAEGLPGSALQARGWDALLANPFEQVRQGVTGGEGGGGVVGFISHGEGFTAAASAAAAAQDAAGGAGAAATVSPWWGYLQDQSRTSDVCGIHRTQLQQQQQQRDRSSVIPVKGCGEGFMGGIWSFGPGILSRISAAAALKAADQSAAAVGLRFPAPLTSVSSLIDAKPPKEQLLMQQQPKQPRQGWQQQQEEQQKSPQQHQHRQLQQQQGHHPQEQQQQRLGGFAQDLSVPEAQQHLCGLLAAWLAPGAPPWWPLFSQQQSPAVAAATAGAGADVWGPVRLVCCLLEMMKHVQGCFEDGIVQQEQEQQEKEEANAGQQQQQQQLWWQQQRITGTLLSLLWGHGQHRSTEKGLELLHLLLSMLVGVGAEVTDSKQQQALLHLMYQEQSSTHQGAATPVIPPSIAAVAVGPVAPTPPAAAAPVVPTPATPAAAPETAAAAADSNSQPPARAALGTTSLPAAAMSSTLNPTSLAGRNLHSVGSFTIMRSKLALLPHLSSAVSSALISISNRMSSEAGSSSGAVVLTKAQQGAVAAELAKAFLPYSLLWPEEVMKRLLLDGMAHR